MDIVSKVVGGQFTKKINKYKYDRVVIASKMPATPVRMMKVVITSSK